MKCLTRTIQGVLVGNIESSARLSCSALGESVNAAAGLESTDTLFGTTMCISDGVPDPTKANMLALPQATHCEGPARAQ
jgi:hypothetical protein